MRRMPIFVEPGARWRSLEKLVSPGFSTKNALKTVKIVCCAYCCGLPGPRERKIGNRRSIGGRSPYQRSRLHGSEVAALPCVHPTFEDSLAESLRNVNQRISKRKRNHLVGSSAVGKRKNVRLCHSEPVTVSLVWESVLSTRGLRIATTSLRTGLAMT